MSAREILARQWHDMRAALAALVTIVSLSFAVGFGATLGAVSALHVSPLTVRSNINVHWLDSSTTEARP